MTRTLNKNSSKIVIENGQIIKVSKDNHGISQRELLTKSWTDWIDYWSVDFDYKNRKEIITVGNNHEKEVWTGNYIFENEWQSFRTKKKTDLELESVLYKYKKPGKYTIAVKVIDILGQDTTQTVEVRTD